MNHTKIYGALIIIAIALALFLLVLFGVNIKVAQSVATEVNSDQQVSIYLEGKQHQYVKDHLDYYYYITNPLNDEKFKCYLKKTDDDNKFDCYVNSSREDPLYWNKNKNGLYPSTFDFGSMKIYEYFIRF